ncbi:MAG: amino acid adenylation domain-containing protein [Betaproteobacteria bacterium]|nr:amino acid adenylation domain-containing protein [Betaproteobacteria bacterium]NDF04858.1 amino acid adenylation domain-containing protein [Betaproteobacteria bacterium]
MSKNFNLANAVWRHSLSAPQSVAIAHNGQTLSYEQFAARAKDVAQRLSKSHHWQTRHDKPFSVGILLSRGLDACVAILGASWAGATYVPISLKLPEDKIIAILSASQLGAIIIDAEGAKLLTDAVLAACPELIIRVDQQGEAQSASQTPYDFSKPVQVNANDLAYVIFTSGTTGTPKGVMIEAGSVHNYLHTIVDRLNLQATDRALETCDISFDFSVHNMFATWQAGAALYILPATLVMNAVKFARTAQLTVWNSVPSLLGMLQLLKVLQTNCLPDLRVTVLGGEALPESTARLWQEVAPNTEIFNLYGPTEATVFCLAQVFSRQAPITSGRDFVSIGVALDGCEAMVVDAVGKQLADGSAGELAIAGAQLAQGYMGQPELTAQKFPVLNGKRWYLTGDYAVKDTSGVFHCLGRIDNQVKISGYRIELEEIDAALRLVSGRDLVGTVAWPVVDGVAKGLVGFIAGTTMDSGELVISLKQKLQPYMVPQRVISLDHMPMNSSGKVDRNALTKMLTEATPSAI